MEFGEYIKNRRGELRKEDSRFSQRQVALRVGIEPTYLSRIERGVSATLSESKIIALARDLGEDPDFLLALNGKVSTDVLEVIRSRPRLFARIVREMKDMPRKVIEEENDYRHIRKRIEMTQEMAGVGFFDLKTDAGLPGYWSKQVYSVLEIDEKLAPTLENLISSLQQDEARTLEKAISAGEMNRRPFEVELAIKKEQKPTRYVHIWGSHEHDAAADRTSILGVVQDVTTRTLMERELGEACSALELKLEEESEKVSEAIYKLKDEIKRRKDAEAKLIATSTKVQERARSQKKFFRQSCHSLRTIIDNCRGIVATGVADGQATALLQQQFDEQGHRASLYLDSILDHLALEEGLAPESENFSAEEMINRLVALFQSECGFKGISLVQSIAPDMPNTLRGGRRRIMQILFATLDRAVQVSGWGEVRLSACYAESDSTLRFTVFSAAAEDASVFEPADGAQSEWTKDSMLRMVPAFVDSLGGQLQIEKSVGVGVGISMNFPVERVFMERDSAASVARASGNQDVSLLVVEDDYTSSLTLSRTLEKQDYRVDCAFSGEEALQALGDKAYDLVLLDVQLPDKNGLDVMAENRSNAQGKNRDTPFIVITAHTMQGDRDMCLDAGAVDYFPKPVDTRKVLEAIKLLTA